MNPKRIPILEYHDISNRKGNEISFHTPYVLKIEKFCQHLEWLKHNRFQTISIDDLDGESLPDKPVIITFDDGHVSNYEHAFPTLKEYGFFATFYIVANYIGGDNHMNVDQIKEMKEAGMHLGSHGMNHSCLTAMGKEEADLEIKKSKALLEEALQSEVRHFSIPYGFYDKGVIRSIREAGYVSVVTEKMGYCRPTPGAFKVLPRFTIKSQIRLNQFISIIRHDLLGMAGAWTKEALLSAAKKALGYNKYTCVKSFLLRLL